MFSTESVDVQPEEQDNEDVTESVERRPAWPNPVEKGDPLYVRSRRDWRKQMTLARKAFSEELAASDALHREAERKKADAKVKRREGRVLAHRVEHDEAWGKLRAARSALSSLRRDKVKAERDKRVQYAVEKRKRDLDIRAAEERFRLARLQSESADSGEEAPFSEPSASRAA